MCSGCHGYRKDKPLTGKWIIAVRHNDVTSRNRTLTKHHYDQQRNESDADEISATFNTRLDFRLLQYLILVTVALSHCVFIRCPSKNCSRLDFKLGHSMHRLPFQRFIRRLIFPESSTNCLIASRRPEISRPLRRHFSYFNLNSKSVVRRLCLFTGISSTSGHWTKVIQGHHLIPFSLAQNLTVCRLYSSVEHCNSQVCFFFKTLLNVKYCRLY